MNNLSFFTKKTLFEHSIQFGQWNMPTQHAIEDKLEGIFQRRYYSNNGPLCTEFEERLQIFLQIKNVICITNEDIALLIILKALNVENSVYISSLNNKGNFNTLFWRNITAYFYDFKLQDFLINTYYLRNTEGFLLGNNIFGFPVIDQNMDHFKKSANLQCIFDATQVFGCTDQMNKSMPSLSDISFISFHKTNMINTLEGACICTSNDTIADIIRDIRIRNNYTFKNKFAKTIGKTNFYQEEINGRMSEAQAALGLLSLDDFEKNVALNKMNFQAYHEYLQDIPGLTSIFPKENKKNNYQSVVFSIDEKEFGLSKDQLYHLLKSENIYCKIFIPINKLDPYNKENVSLPVSEKLANTTIQFPSGRNVNEESIKNICSFIKYIYDNKVQLKQKLSY